MKAQVLAVVALCALFMTGCGPSGPSPAAYHPAIAPLPANPGPTMSEAGPAPPAFDRYGQANYDASGAYIGGHGIGTTVDNPDQTSFGIPKSQMPDMSSMHCTGSSGANAGNMSCSN
jgi:hypothetical protein